MIALWIIGGLVLLLFLLSLLRVRVVVEYGGEISLLHLRVGWFRFKLWPKEDEETGQASKKAKGKKPSGETEPKSLSFGVRKLGGSIKRLRALLSIVMEGVSRVQQKLQVDLLHLEYISGGENPAKAAIGFGRASAVFGIFLPILENTFHIKKKVLRAGVNYNWNEPSIYLKLSLSMRLFQILSLAIWFGRQYLRQKKAMDKDTIPAKGEGSPAT